MPRPEYLPRRALLIFERIFEIFLTCLLFDKFYDHGNRKLLFSVSLFLRLRYLQEFLFQFLSPLLLGVLRQLTKLSTENIEHLLAIVQIKLLTIYVVGSIRVPEA